MLKWSTAVWLTFGASQGNASLLTSKMEDETSSGSQRGDIQPIRDEAFSAGRATNTPSSSKVWWLNGAPGPVANGSVRSICWKWLWVEGHQTQFLLKRQATFFRFISTEGHLKLRDVDRELHYRNDTFTASSGLQTSLFTFPPQCKYFLLPTDSFFFTCTFSWVNLNTFPVTSANKHEERALSSRFDLFLKNLVLPQNMEQRHC